MRLAAALAVLALWAGAQPSAAREAPQVVPAWIAPAWGPGREAVPALLSLPPGWSAGDAAVVVAGPRGAAPPGLVAALLAQDAAVLELALPASEPAAGLLAGALRNLAETQGAGLVVAIALGEPAGAAVRHIVPPYAAAWRIAAAVVLEVRGSEVLAATGPGPAPEQGWTIRAPLLCATLARTLPLDGAACAAALVP